MKIVIVGAGTVGSSIAQFLVKEKSYEVVIVDTKGEKLNTLEDADVQTLEGNACDPHTLRQLDIQDADAFLAVTDKDETNLIAAYAAKNMGAKRVAARVRSRFFIEGRTVDFSRPLGIDLLISPEISTAEELSQFISAPGVQAIHSLAGGAIEAVTLRVDENSPLIGKTLHQLHIPEGVLVAGFRRDDMVQIARGNTKLEPGDRVTLIGLHETIVKMAPLIDHAINLQESDTSVVIAGAGETGLALAENLEKRKKLKGTRHRITVIDKDIRAAKRASSRLSHARVLCGDATNKNFLSEIHVDRSEYYIAAMGDDENNIMSSLLAKELGVKKAACLIDRPDYTRIIEKIGIDLAISPRFVVANYVMRLIKRGRIRGVTLLEEGELEISEYQALSRSGVTGKRLKDLGVPSEALIGALLQGKNVVVPRGDSVITPGNLVITVAKPEAAEELDNLFAENTP